MKITTSSPGKLMLFGEHAVLHGFPCIVTAVDQRLFLTLEVLDDKSLLYIKSQTPKIDIKIPIKDLGNKNIPKDAKFISTAVDNFLKKYFKEFKGSLKITTKSEFSSKLGFGSSSAVTVSCIKALTEVFNVNLSNKRIFDLAYKTVLDVQGKGSGFDVAAATYGGTLYFVKGGKVIKPLKITNLPLIVGYSGIKADTVTLIDKVNKKAESFPKLVKNTYNLIGNLVNQSSKYLLEEDFKALGELMNINQGFLYSLGASISKLDNMINAANLAGAYGAKLSGAGGGDCIITLVPPSNIKAVQKVISKAGGKIINVKTNVPGVRIEK